MEEKKIKIDVDVLKTDVTADGFNKFAMMSNFVSRTKNVKNPYLFLKYLRMFLQDYINYVNSGKDDFYVTEDENLAYLEFLEKLEKGEIKDND
jgi:hypothetical protein